MSAEKNRSSLLAIVAESVTGTYVPPSAGSQFIALQEGFRFQPNFQTLENAEIRASIGVAQPIQGLEQPNGNFDHYFRASGVEGSAPGYGLLLKSIMGSVTANATERTATTGGSVSSLILGAGGSDFARGFAVLLKNALYEVRPIHSVSSNTLTPGFNFLNAPTNGVGVGKCVNYSPANTGHPSLSLSLYRGNGAAVEAIAGALASQVSFRVQAGQIINGSFQVQGTKYLDFTDDDGTVTATVTEGIYRDPHELAAAITSAMNAANGAQTATCVYLDASGKFKITSTGTVLSLLWKTGTHGNDNDDKHIGNLIGFDDAANDTGTAAGTGYTSDSAINLAAAKSLYSFVVTSANKYIDFTNDDETESACAVAEGTYTSPYALADAVAAAMNAASPGETHTVTFNSTSQKFKIKSTGTVLSLLWKTGTHGSDNSDDHIGTLLGFSDAADDSGTAATTGYTADNAVTSTTLAASYDNADPQVAKNNEVLVGDSTNTSCFCASTVDVTITNEIQNVECVCAESGVQEKIINKRTVELQVTAILERYNVDLFKRYRSNADVRFSYTFGSKSGGNWVAGTIGNLYVPVAKVSAHEIGDNNGLVTLQVTVTPYVDANGNGEFYINFL